jgi:DNA-binding response OmpR family regulator
MRLLLVEDEEMLGRVTAQSLVKAGYAVDWVQNGQDARGAAAAHEYDAILLDLGLPDIPGESIVKELRASRSITPVIVMTARGQIEDRVSILDLGADDYLVKPVDIAEVGARIRAVQRRAANGLDCADIQKIGPLELQQASRLVRWNGEVVVLTSKLYDVLEALVLRRPRVVSRAQLEDALYGWGDEVDSNAIEVYIHMLRRRFTPGLIQTVRGKGYMLGSEDVLTAEARKAAKSEQA